MNFNKISRGASAFFSFRRIRHMLFSRYSGYRYYDGIDRFEYYQGLNVLKQINDFQRFLQLHNGDPDSFLYSGRITPMNIDFSSSESLVIQNLGKPRFIIENNFSVFSHRVLFFKSRIAGFSFMAQFHFLDNSLWLIKQDISSKNSSAHDLGYINKLLLKKYSLDFQNAEIPMRKRISDLAGNQMLVTHSISTEIIYLRESPAITNAITRWVDLNQVSKGKDSQYLEQKIMAIL